MTLTLCLLVVKFFISMLCDIPKKMLKRRRLHFIIHIMFSSRLIKISLCDSVLSQRSMFGRQNRVEAVKAMMQRTRSRTGCSKTLEQVPFPEAEVRALYPELVEVWTTIGQSQNVPWQWVMVMELSLATFLAPIAVLMPTRTIKIFLALWSFLLHPGSTHTSNSSRCIVTCSTSLRAWSRVSTAPIVHNGSVRPGDISMTARFWFSQKLMALPQDIGRSCSFMIEGKKFLMWLQNEGNVNESIVVELHERSKWEGPPLIAFASISLRRPRICWRPLRQNWKQRCPTCSCGSNLATSILSMQQDANYWWIPHERSSFQDQMFAARHGRPFRARGFVGGAPVGPLHVFFSCCFSFLNFPIEARLGHEGDHWSTSLLVRVVRFSLAFEEVLG